MKKYVAMVVVLAVIITIGILVNKGQDMVPGDFNNTTGSEYKI